jgi:hypothetical protein
MLYPETSPTSPVSRDDLAQTMALQQMMFQRGPGALGPDGQVIGALGGQALGGPQGTPFVAGDYDPTGGGEDSMGGGYASQVSGFTPTGRDTSDQSQAAQGRDAAAMAAAAQAAGRDFSSNTQGNAITGPLSGPGFGALSQSATNSPISENAVTTTAVTAPGATQSGQQYSGPNFGTPGKAGVLGDQFDAFAGAAVTPTGGSRTAGIVDPVSGFPSTSFVSDMFDAGKNSFAQGWGGVGNFDPGNAGIVSDIMGQVAGSRGDLADMTSGGGKGGAVSGGGGGRGGGVSDPGNAGLVGDIMGQVSGSVADLGNMGGGFSGFGATGGYSGSADMSNTGGAQGFGGGAVGGFGGGDAGPGGDGSGGSSGSSSDGSSSSGDNSGGSSGVG